jgi:hypothetical protein
VGSTGSGWRAIRGGVTACALLACCLTLGSAAAVEPLDPLQQAVCDSLAFPVRTAPREFLDAAIRAADVDALEVSLGYVGRLVEAVDKAGADRLETR